jgi:hypothetical protein
MVFIDLSKQRTKEFLLQTLVVYVVQPMQLGVTFSNAVSKLKAQSSNVSFATFQ